MTVKRMIKGIVLMIVMSGVCGCSTVGKSLALGASIGGVSGAMMGEGFTENHSAGRATGALIGTVLGGLVGYLAHKDKSEIKPAQKAQEEDTPMLTRPKVRRVWVKDEIKGRRFVKGHWEYVLEENSEWSR